MKHYPAPEVAATYQQARELCRQVGETPQLLPVLGGLVVFYLNRNELQTARELGEQMLDLAQRLHDPAALGHAHIIFGERLVLLRSMGRCPYTPGTRPRPLQFPAAPRPMASSPDHLGVFGLSRLTQILWDLGYPAQALQRSQEALTLAREWARPIHFALALNWAAQFHLYRREGQRAYELAEAALALAREHGFVLRVAQATLPRGWALVAQGQMEAGIAQIREGLGAVRATGVESMGDLALLAEACGSVGQIEEGLQAIAEALASENRSGGETR